MHTALFTVLSCSWLPASVICVEFIVSHQTAQLNVATDLQEASSGQWLLRPSSVDEWISWLFLQKVERNLDAENFYLQVCALCSSTGAHAVCCTVLHFVSALRACVRHVLARGCMYAAQFSTFGLETCGFAIGMCASAKP